VAQQVSLMIHFRACVGSGRMRRFCRLVASFSGLGAIVIAIAIARYPLSGEASIRVRRHGCDAVSIPGAGGLT
jgi:hypothetical protein